MRSTRGMLASGSVAIDGQTDVDHSTIQNKGKGKRTAGKKRTSAPLRDLVVANRDVNAEIAELKGESHSNWPFVGFVDEVCSSASRSTTSSEGG